MLQDHFHPPLSDIRHWNSFHHAWATNLTADINARLPDEWFAEPNVQFGIEIDVATFEQVPVIAGGPEPKNPATVQWSPPAPSMTIEFPLTTDVVEVRLFRETFGRELVGAIELISPANKDRPETRDALVAKCETFLHDAVGLVVVDIVTNRRANLHDLLMQRLGEHPALDTPSLLYAVAYRPTERADFGLLEIWSEALALGRELPNMPLFLKNGPCIAVDLENTYLKTCSDLKITPMSANDEA